MNDCINIPQLDIDFNEPPFRGGWQQLLNANIGKDVKIDFLIGGNIVSNVGTVLSTSTQYVLIKCKNGTVVSGDIFAIKFISFLCDC